MFALRKHNDSAEFVIFILCILNQPERSIKVKLALAGCQRGPSREQGVLLMRHCWNPCKHAESGRTCGLHQTLVDEVMRQIVSIVGFKALLLSSTSGLLKLMIKIMSERLHEKIK